MDVGGRAMYGTIAGKARMRGYNIKQLISFILSPGGRWG
jgi:hypothetical protein